MAVSADKVLELVEQTVSGMGFEFVGLEYLPRGLMRVTIDTESGVGVDDCERVSDQLTRLFAVEEIDFDRLEISSPGVDRPLRRARDWVRFIGKRAHVELYTPLQAEGLPEAGRRRFDGIILAAEGEGPETRIQFEIREDKVPRTPAQAAMLRAAARRSGKKPESSNPVTVEFAMADVDRACLVAELDFKGGRK